MKKTLIRDIGIVAVILIICAAAILLMSDRESGQWAVVTVDTVEVARYDLGVNGVYELNGGSNVLVIENHRASVVEADCPDKLCIHQGQIWGAGQMIVCLPNKLMVTIEGVSSGVDIVVN